MNIGYIASGTAKDKAGVRLLAAHKGMAVWSADRAVIADLQQQGAKAAASAAELVRQSDIVLVALADSSLVQALLSGDGEVSKAVSKGKIIVDLSAGTVQVARDMAQQLAAKGATLLNAPILATAAQAAPGDLTLVVSGPKDAYDKALSALQAITTQVMYGGTQAGNAQVVRMIDRTMVAAAGLASLEAVAAGRKMGLTLASMTEVFVKGSGRNYTTRFVLPALNDGKNGLDATIADVSRDVNEIVSLGIARGIPTPMASVARGLMQAASNALGKDAAFQEMGQVVASMAKTSLPDTAAATGPAEATSAASADATPTIGYVGLGAMGAPLARRLMLTYKVHAYDVRPEAARALEAEGAVAETDLAALARKCDVIVLCVPSSSIVREVLFGKGGLAEGLSPGKVVIDQTTGDPDEAVEIAAELQKLGVPMVDAPVSGGPETPPLGTAVMICGGPADAFARALPILKAIGPTVIYCGPVGSGHAAKLVNNASNICNRLIAYEAAMIGTKCGIPLDVFHQAVNKSVGWSFAAERVFKAVASHAKTASISLDLSLKDIASAVRMGIDCGAPMLMGDMARNIFAMGVHQFGGDANVDELAHLYEKIASIDFTKAATD